MSGEIHTCIFVFVDNAITRYKVMKEKNGSPFFKPLLGARDEKELKFTPETFWEEWERDSGFASEHTIDYAVISDTADFRLEIPPEKKYPVCDPTLFFTRERAHYFMETCLPYDNMSLSYLGKEERIKNIVSNGGKKFFLCIPYPIDLKPKVHLTRDDYSLGSYCDEKIQEWNARRKIFVKK